jgi:hypothetical protein
VSHFSIGGELTFKRSKIVLAKTYIKKIGKQGCPHCKKKITLTIIGPEP